MVTARRSRVQRRRRGATGGNGLASKSLTGWRPVPVVAVEEAIAGATAGWYQITTGLDQLRPALREPGDCAWYEVASAEHLEEAPEGER
jgi:hypothetical protein